MQDTPRSELAQRLQLAWFSLKLQLGSPGRSLFLGLCALTASVAVVLLLSPSARERLACSEAVAVQFSPGGKYSAQMTEKSCHWSLVQARNPAHVKVSLQDNPNRYIDLPLEYYGSDRYAAPAPAFRWKNAHALEVIVYSNDLSGTLVRHFDTLTLTRRYVKPPKGTTGKPADAALRTPTPAA